MIRAVFTSANINLKDETLYSPLLESIIRGFNKHKNMKAGKQGKKSEQNYDSEVSQSHCNGD